MSDTARVWPLYNIEFDPIDLQEPAKLKYKVTKREPDGTIVPFLDDIERDIAMAWVQEFIERVVVRSPQQVTEGVDRHD